MYAAIGTWPDISFTISILSQFLDYLGQVHGGGSKASIQIMIGYEGLEVEIWRREGRTERIYRCRQGFAGTF
jgi:hypothetical protein